MEELNVQFGSDFEAIEKLTHPTGFNYPVIFIGEKTIYCNRPSAPLIGDAVRWMVSSEYVVGLKAPKYSTNAFNVTWCGERLAKMTMPVQLRTEKKLRRGYYKLYRCSGGFVFKRYEPIRLLEDDN